MKISLHKLACCSLLLLFLFRNSDASAQVTASLETQRPILQSRKANKSLKDFLDNVEKQFKVYFTFESSLVKNTRVNSDAAITGNLEETLERVLRPLSLEYEKVSDKYYAIFKSRPEESQQQSEDSVQGDSTLEVSAATDTVEAAADAFVNSLIRVSGTITDEAGVGMPGVNVVEKGTSNGVVTDVNGEYRIDVQSEQSILIVSFVGYNTVEETVGSRTEISIQITPDVRTLSEVVVVGYGTQERKNMTAAVSSISTEQIENRPVTNMFQALQGLAPNLTIQQNVAEPGSVQTINIRGVGSFTDNSPLIMVDGIVVGNLGLQYLNPNDVESISILKDAASSAIYGSQAANGVIYITTKKGTKEEKATIQYSGMFGLQSPTTSPKAVEAWEFMTLKNEALANSGQNAEFTPQQIAEQRARGSYPWAYDELVNNVVPQYNQNLSISGGGKNTSYLLSGGYLNQQSFFNGSHVPDDNRFYYKRYNFRGNISTEINKYIRTDVNLSFTNAITRTHPFSTGILMRDAMRTPRIYPIKDSLGFIVPKNMSNSVFAQLSKGGYKMLNSNNLLGGLNVTVTPLDGLKITLNGSANYSFYNEEVQVRAFRYDSRFGSASPPLKNEQSKAAWKDMTRTFFATAEYERSFGLHTGKVLVGYRSDYVENFSMVGATRVNGTVLDGRYMIDGEFYRSNDGTVEEDIGRLSRITNPELKTINSVFGRVNYDFDDKYLAEFTWRYDGATVLAPENRWFFFPALSLGWRMTKEPFMEAIRDNVGDIKLRYSIGQVGNSNIGGFNYLSRVSRNPGLYSFNNTSAPGVSYSTVNPELEWERSTMSNYGIDADLFDNKVSVSLDYFDKVTDGIYFAPAVPGTLGQGAPIQNFAKVRNVGWEMSINWRPVTGPVNHQVSVNVADNTNKIIKLGPQMIEGFDFKYIWKEGFPISSYYLYKSDGLYQNLDDLETAPSVPFANGGKVNPGDIRYIDKNSDGVIDEDNDRFILGTPFPRYTFGITYGATWKNFDFQMFWQGVGKRVQYLRGDVVEAFHNNEEHLFVQHKDRWIPTNPDATYPRLTATTGANTNNTAYSDYWLFDTKYIRLKNLQVGYSLPKAWIGKVGMQHMRVYFSAQNLLTFAPKRFARLGMDPEFTQFDNKLSFANYNAIAGRNYPNAKVLSLGLDIRF